MAPAGKPHRKGVAWLISCGGQTCPTWQVHDHTVQVLIDADNLDVARLRLFVAALDLAPSAEVVVAGAPSAWEALDWPPDHHHRSSRERWRPVTLLAGTLHRSVIFRRCPLTMMTRNTPEDNRVNPVQPHHQG